MEKFAVHTTRFFIVMASLCILSMIIWAFAPSWSQNHMSWLGTDALLYTTLLSIFGVYLTRALTHPEAKENMLKIWAWSINLRTLSITTAMFFFGVAIFGVNNPVKWIAIAHLITTGLGTLFAYLEMYNYPKTTIGRAAAIVGMVVGGGGFIWSLISETLTVAQGEGIAALPMIIHIWSTSKVK